MEHKRRRVEVLLRLPNNRFIGEKLLDPNRPGFGRVRCPGGKIEEGETPEEALVREMQEEYGLSLNSDNLHFIAECKGPHRQNVRLEYPGEKKWIGKQSADGTEQLVETCNPRPW